MIFFLVILIFLSPIMFIVIPIMGIRCYNLYMKQDKEWRPFLIEIILVCLFFLPFWYLFFYGTWN
jgi:cytochrome c biogenesis protein CcdA